MMISGRQDEGFEQFAEEVFGGESAAVRRLRLQVARIAPHFRIALLTGERGVGKRTVAREMHRLGPVASGPFSEREIAEFSAADEASAHEATRMGRGTLFLRGLEALRPELQERLLERLKTIHRETRVVVASECDLKGMVAAGRMRPDLHVRVGMLEIRVAPLRERMEDVAPLLKTMLKRLGCTAEIGREVFEKMKGYGWPGNLAELWDLAGRVSVAGRELGVAHVAMRAAEERAHGEPTVRLEEVMQRHVMDVLQRCSGNKLRTAEMLGISRSTLYRMLEMASPSVRA